jgi:diguanylate cyclase (GGDEF)-like protein/PAS domain S-box-containing protein
VDGRPESDDLFQFAPQAMWVFEERELRIMAINQAALALFGYSEQEISGKTLFDLKPAFRHGALAALVDVPPPDAEKRVQRYRCKDGSTIELSVEIKRLTYQGQAARLASASTHTDAQANRIDQRAARSLAQTLDSITEGFFALNTDLRITLVNDRGAELMGYAPADLVGKRIYDVFPELPETAFGIAYERVLAEQTSQHVEDYFAAQDRWYTLHAFPSDGGVAAYFSDVTAQHRAAETLQRSHEQFELAAEATNDVIWERDLRTGETWVGASIERVFGLSRHTFESEKEAWSKHVHADDLEATRASLKDALDQQARYWHCEYRLKRGDGSYAQVLSRAMVVRENGQAVRLVGALQDVTQARAYERRLLDYESIVNAAPSGIVLVDTESADMPLLYVNPAFEKITGYKAAEVIGRNCRFLQGAAHDQDAIRSFRDAIKARRADTMVLRNYRKDGSMFWNHLIVTPVSEPNQPTRRMVGIITDVTAQRRSEDALEFHYTHDTLTGLLNRDLIEDRLSEALAYGKRHGTIVAVLSLSLDGFKAINDSVGFAAGDELLRHVARQLTNTVRDTDAVARVIADEYLCVCHVASLDRVDALAARVLHAIAKPIGVNGREIRAQASMGVSINSEAGDDSRELLRKANAALLEAKAVARGSFKLHRASMDYRISDRLALAARLRSALDQGRFELHYQLQTQTVSGRIHGAEALLRLRKTDGTLASPQEFMAVAESTGLIVPIGHWVLQEACRQAMRWRAEGMDAMTISVNVSIAQFKRAGFVDEVREVLETSGLPPACLELEITETLAMDGVESFIETLSSLKQLGLRIALDDFGTGFSSLTYLRRFAVDTLKIDRSFVKDITTDAKDAAICRTIINMAHNLGMTAIAEGVETTAQASYLGRNGCDRLQGFLLHRPAPASELQQRAVSGEAFFTPSIKIDDQAATVMVLDDDELVGQALSHVIERAGFHTVVVDNIPDAFETMALQLVDVVVADERMPDMRGSDFLLAIKELYPQTVRILQSGTLDANVIAGALNQAEIFRYLSKGASENQITSAIHAAVESVKRSQPINLV